MLFPFLLTVVIFILAKGFISPLSEPIGKTYPGSALAFGFTNGYATAEILCALIFGMVVIDNLEKKA